MHRAPTAILTALLLAAGMLFAGCGGDRAGDQPAAGETATTPETPATTPGTPGTTPTARGEEAAAPIDSEDDAALRRLAEHFEIQTEPFEEPRAHRGAGRRVTATLLWPQKDVRPEGLQTYAIEIGDDYDLDAAIHLEFRKGRDVLYSEPFLPETTVVVGTVPAAVREAVGAGDDVTWGLVPQEGRMKPVTTKFELTANPKAGKRIEKILTARYLDQQEPIVRQLLVAQALLDYRLYTEALAMALALNQEDPDHPQPYKLIVATLRRLDAEDTVLWAATAPYVSGNAAGRHEASGTLQRDFGAGARGATLVDPTQTPGAIAQGTGPVAPRVGGSIAPGVRPAPGVPTPGATDPAAGATDGTATPHDPRDRHRPGGEGQGDHDPIAEELGRAERMADQAEGRAAEAAEQAARVAEAARDAERAAEEAEAAIAQGQDDPRQKALAADLRRTADQMREEAQTAQAEAAKEAERAKRLAQDRDQLREVAQAMGRHPGGHGPGSDPGAGTAGLSTQLTKLTNAAQEAQDRERSLAEQVQALEAVLQRLSSDGRTPGAPVAPALVEERRQAQEALQALQLEHQRAEEEARLAADALRAAQEQAGIAGATKTAPLSPELEKLRLAAEEAVVAERSIQEQIEANEEILRRLSTDGRSPGTDQAAAVLVQARRAATEALAELRTQQEAAHIASVQAAEAFRQAMEAAAEKR